MEHFRGIDMQWYARLAGITVLLNIMIRKLIVNHDSWCIVLLITNELYDSNK